MSWVPLVRWLFFVCLFAIFFSPETLRFFLMFLQNIFFQIVRFFLLFLLFIANRSFWRSCSFLFPKSHTFYIRSTHIGYSLIWADRSLFSCLWILISVWLMWGTIERQWSERFEKSRDFALTWSLQSKAGLQSPRQIWTNNQIWRYQQRSNRFANNQSIVYAAQRTQRMKFTFFKRTKRLNKLCVLDVPENDTNCDKAKRDRETYIFFVNVDHILVSRLVLDSLRVFI